MFENQKWSEALKKAAEKCIDEILYEPRQLIGEREIIKLIALAIEEVKGDPTEYGVCDACERIDPSDPPEPRYNEGMD